MQFFLCFIFLVNTRSLNLVVAQDNQMDLAEFKKQGVIPDVINHEPEQILSAEWHKKAAQLGNELKPSEVILNKNIWHFLSDFKTF